MCHVCGAQPREGYREFSHRFRAGAQDADFEGCLAQADAMAGA
jgi:hypothetical protein